MFAVLQAEVILVCYLCEVKLTELLAEPCYIMLFYRLTGTCLPLRAELMNC